MLQSALSLTSSANRFLPMSALRFLKSKPVSPLPTPHRHSSPANRLTSQVTCRSGSRWGSGPAARDQTRTPSLLNLWLSICRSLPRFLLNQLSYGIRLEGPRSIPVFTHEHHAFPCSIECERARARGRECFEHNFVTCDTIPALLVPPSAKGNPASIRVQTCRSTVSGIRRR